MKERPSFAYQLALLLPVYGNFPKKLLEEAYRQLQDLSIPTALYILDDGSPEPLPDLEDWTTGRPNVYFRRWSQNGGRSAARNHLAAWAQAEYQHFLDDQLVVSKPDFWKTLWAHRLPQGIVFGPAYPPKQPKPGTELRWKVARLREFARFPPADPYPSFKSGHFLAHHSIWKQVQFEEGLRGYGHEDTLLGLSLQAQQIPLRGLDLPVSNAELDGNSEFLQKVEQSLHNLQIIARRYPDYKQHFGLLRLHGKLRRWRLTGLVYFLLAWGQKWMRRHLQGGQPSLRIFDLYRLIFLIRLMRSDPEKH